MAAKEEGGLNRRASLRLGEELERWKSSAYVQCFLAMHGSQVISYSYAIVRILRPSKLGGTEERKSYMGRRAVATRISKALWRCIEDILATLSFYVLDLKHFIPPTFGDGTYWGRSVSTSP